MSKSWRTWTVVLGVALAATGCAEVSTQAPRNAPNGRDHGATVTAEWYRW